MFLPYIGDDKSANGYMILPTNNGPLYYEVLGEGQPLVLISGWAMSCECWRPAVEFLAAGHRCLLYDARGMARSQPADATASFTIEDHAEDLHAVMDAAGMFDAVFIAHEMGALMAAACADAHPQDVRSLVLVSPRASFSKDEIKSLSVFTPASLALREIASFPLIRNLVALRFRHAPQPYRDTLFDDFAELSPRAAYETALAAAEYYESRPLEKIVKASSTPLLLVCGEKDKAGLTQARQLFSLAKSGKFARMKDCGFLPMLEYARQFARLIDDFTDALITEGNTIIPIE
ncbi:MAG: alpha/beta hydrolase [Acidobacteria bacterium]|nr:alpha/beta hydrolase [Acidobacteriota bacterium]